MLKQRNTLSIQAKKILSEFDSFSATCPQCGRNFDLSSKRSSCDSCGSKLVLAREKDDAKKIELLLAEAAEEAEGLSGGKSDLERQNAEQERAINRAAAQNGISLDRSDGYLKAYCLALTENPALFKPVRTELSSEEMILSDANGRAIKSLAELNTAQVSAIEQVAKSHGLSIKSFEGLVRCYGLALAENPRLFDPKAGVRKGSPQ